MPERARSAIAVTTAVMACSMAFLQTVGAQGPRLRELAGIGTGELGVLVALAFGVAALTSAAAGRLVGRIGARSSALVLLAAIAATFALVGALPRIATLAVAALLAGVAQALANPATNVTLMRLVAPARRSLAVGIKQSGVQLGALVFGLGLTLAAAALSFGAAMAIGAALAGATALALVRVVPADRVAGGAGAARPDAGAGSGPAARPKGAAVPALEARLRALRRCSFALGCGIAALNAYLGVYAHDSLGVSLAWAGAPAAILGIAGIVGRVAWLARERAEQDPVDLLPALALGAAAATGLLAAAPVLGDWPAWPAIALIGVTAVGANTVSMAAVMTAAPPAHVARGSAVVAGAFFLGFVVGPPAFAGLQGAIGYGAAWAATAAAFLLAAAVTAPRGARIALPHPNPEEQPR